jgi:Tfp pilus assembly protein PilN
VIRGNLATRPFYNERAVHFWLLVVAILVVAATAFNVSRVLKYSRSDTELATSASRDEERAADLRRQAAQLRASVDPRQVEFASVEAQQANELIDRRTFSWTEVFNYFEMTLPDDVRIGAVHPRIDKEHQIVLTINVVARDTQDVKKFMDNLDETGAFVGTLAREDHFDDQGQLQALVEAIYRPPTKQAAAQADAPKPPKQAAAPRGEAPKPTGAARR